MTTAAAYEINPDVIRRARLRALVTRRFDLSVDTPARFFGANAEAISDACRAMARRFQRGGRLLVFGAGANATDAQHVAVEFVHPVIVGKRALPSIALTNDVASITAPARDQITTDHTFAAMLATLGRAEDIALQIACGNAGAHPTRALAHARTMQILTISIVQETSGTMWNAAADHVFVVPGDDALVAQEVSETLYHVLWELVHLFLEHGPRDGPPGVPRGTIP